MTIPLLLHPDDDVTPFPDIELALEDPDGLLAVGGKLSTRRLLAAYRQGIFPWFSEDQPILWWSPNPRMVLFPERLHVSRSLAKLMRKRPFRISFDQAFEQVIEGCAAIRREREGTWITADMQAAYIRLYRLGHAHSVEAWQGDKLVGGLYGLAMGQVFFGESMFSQVSNASKVAFVTLVQNLRRWNYRLIDCQVTTRHLQTLGAEEIPRHRFAELLAETVEQPTVWQPDT